jgi:hypothetical protein
MENSKIELRKQLLNAGIEPNEERIVYNTTEYGR